VICQCKEANVCKRISDGFDECLNPLFVT